ncbi:sugar 3,4-ketoisomerase [Larkinella sp. VNQ87]|uniref:sugar 3,4-ketoisomerase n=1 Tax=Larkinella sp. VNQ87 TaxID=3400921 RepID=UPI003C070E83
MIRASTVGNPSATGKNVRALKMARLYTIRSTTNLIPELEAATGLTFQRSYLIYNVPAEARRGNHRHRKNHSILLCLAGSVTVFVQSAQQDSVYELSAGGQALHLFPPDWRMLYNFSPGCVLLALASHYYSSFDYVTKPYRSTALEITESIEIK